MHKTRRTVGAGLVLGLVGTLGLAACGDDDEGSTTDTTEAQTALASDGAGAAPEFCEGMTNVDAAVSGMPEDPAAIEAYAAEHITPAIEQVEAHLPDEVTDEVTVMADAVEAAITGDYTALESPEFSDAAGVVYPFLGEECGFQTVEVSAVDFAYEGIPETLDAGMTVFTMTNDSAAGEIHEIGFVRVKDGVDLTMDELFALPEEEVGQYVEFGQGIFLAPGAQGGATLDLQPGRYIYACFIPVGSIDGAEGTGVPHFMEGMAGEFTVA